MSESGRDSTCNLITDTKQKKVEHHVFCLFRYQSQPVPLVSVDEVNQWVENTTNGHIPNFLESIPHDVVLMLMNAVYFKGKAPGVDMCPTVRTLRRLLTSIHDVTC